MHDSRYDWLTFEFDALIRASSLQVVAGVVVCRHANFPRSPKCKCQLSSSLMERTFMIDNLTMISNQRSISNVCFRSSRSPVVKSIWISHRPLTIVEARIQGTGYHCKPLFLPRSLWHGFPSQTYSYSSQKRKRERGLSHGHCVSYVALPKRRLSRAFPWVSFAVVLRRSA